MSSTPTSRRHWACLLGVGLMLAPAIYAVIFLLPPNLFVGLFSGALLQRPAMMPATAITFAVAGLGLWGLSSFRLSRQAGRQTAASSGAALVLLSLAWLLSTLLYGAGPEHPLWVLGLTSPQTAVGFGLTGLAIFALARHRWRAGRCLTTTLLLYVLIMSVGLLFGARVLFATTTGIGVSVPTDLGFIAVAWGLLLRLPGSRIRVLHLFGLDVRGLALLMATTLLAAALGALLLHAIQQGSLDLRTALSLLVLLACVLGLGTINGLGRRVYHKQLVLERKERHQRRAAERNSQALHAATERLARIAASAPGHIVAFSIDAHDQPTLDYSSADLELLSGRAAHTDQQPLLHNVHPDDLTALKGSFARARLEAGPWHCNWRYQHPERGTVWMEGRAQPIWQSNGELRWHGFLVDTSTEHQARMQLHTRSTELSTLMEILPVGIYIAKDPDCLEIVGNDLGRRLLGQDPGDNLSLSAPESERPSGFRPFRDGVELAADDLPLQRAALGQAVDSEEVTLLFDDDQSRHLIISAAPVRDESGATIGAVGGALDVTRLKTAESALRREKELLAVTLESIGEGVITTDTSGRLTFLNRVAEALTGWSLDEATGQPIVEILKLRHARTGASVLDPVTRCLHRARVTALGKDINLINRHGIEIPIEDSAAPIHDGDGHLVGVVLVFRDVTEQRRLAAEVAHQASHDLLTGLVNRREFELRLDRVINTARAYDSAHALCFMDLDQFKVVNDTCGHEAGDQLLRQLATLMQGELRTRDTLARLGGDEFGLLLEYCSLEQAYRVADVLRRVVEDFLFVWKDRPFRVGVSIGLVPINASTQSVASVLQAADSACYAAKDSGRNRIHEYHPDDELLARQQGALQWVTRLQQALETGGLELHAQPIVPVAPDPCRADGADGQLHLEVLVRLREARQGLVTPGMFMPAAERYNLGTRIDRWVVQALLDAFAAHPRWHEQVQLCSINLSGQSVGDPVFQKFLFERLDETPLAHERLCFEITET
ncbi:MAG: diguanylate cyclase, partial [Gammaproteobacteria bacterium]|nr:diguanylate cyclase [Gammaproteobacteria bacterium]